MATKSFQRARRASSKAPPVAERALDGVQKRFPGWLGEATRTVRGHDILLLSAGVGFYGLLSLAPLVILAFWVISLLLGDESVRSFAQLLGRVAPEQMGLDRLLRQVAEAGTSVGVVALITSLWPATAYGSAIARALERLSPRKESLEGVRGRGLALAFLLPLFVLGGLVGSYLGTTFLGDQGALRILGWLLALMMGFAATAVSVALIYRILPPAPLRWRRLLWATSLSSFGISVLSLLFTLFLTLGADFREHYPSSAVALVVLVGLWLYLANALVLAGYRMAVEH
jgi:YihY family inner membrane protein